MSNKCGPYHWDIGDPGGSIIAAGADAHITVVYLGGAEACRCALLVYLLPLILLLSEQTGKHEQLLLLAETSLHTHPGAAGMVWLKACLTARLKKHEHACIHTGATWNLLRK